MLEHIPEPLPFLEEMFRDLSKGGVLFIEVPHVSDMYNFPLDNERFAIPHIYFFSENTLGALLEKAGFKIIETRVFDASRNRTYLQIVAEKNKAIKTIKIKFKGKIKSNKIFKPEKKS